MQKYTVTYAQNREDILIRGFFPEVKQGFYVDVGANHPADDSVTKLFYDAGWNGINIEPNERLFSQIAEQRPRDINLKVGVSDKKGTLILREYANHGLSTFSNEMKDSYLSEESAKTSSYKDVEVSVVTLVDIFSEHVTKKPIHFMKVDVEGFEYEVLQGNDWKKYRPELICIESNHLVKDWRPILNNAKYEIVFNDGLNDYYLAQESSYRKEFFNYPEIMLTGLPVVNPNIYDKLQQLEVARKTLQTTEREIITLQESRNELFMQLQRHTGLKAQLRALATEVYARLNKRIENIGRFKAATKAPEFKENAKGSNIDQYVKEYDSRAFSEKYTIGGASSRIFSKLLKTLLKTFVRFLKLLARALRRIKRGVRR
jgi:FkbM family methyltransferase